MLTLLFLLESTGKKIDKYVKKCKFRYLIAILLFFNLIVGNKLKVARSEGSRDLVESGLRDRPYTEFNTLTTAGIRRQTLVEVYVNAGEEVYLGSSSPDSDLDANNPADIVFRSPLGGQNGTCDVNRTTGFGFIDTVAKETAGPQIPGIPNPNGYIPCTFTATETGIYEVEFRVPDFTPAGNNPPPIGATAQFPTNNTQRGTVSAWDVTVVTGRAIGNLTVQPGRAYAKYFALNLGSNNREIDSLFYVLTQDGFQYELNLNSIDPFGFLLFSNSRGFIDNDGSTLYRSAVAPNNSLDPFSGGILVQNPTAPDNPATNSFTHLTFLNVPDPNIIAALGIPTSPAIPQPPANFTFRGAVNGTNNETFVGSGGNFTFDAAQGGSFQIIIDTNNNGTFGDGNDRVLRNFAVFGSNTVPWDGRDEAGNIVPGLPNNAPYNARIILNVGEYHFPLIDSENDPDGFVIRNLNPPAPYPNIPDQNGVPINEFTIFYDDRNYTTANGTFVSLDPIGTQIATTPRNASAGINSSLGEHEFNNRYGDFKGIDTWAYFPSEPRTAQIVIVSAVRGTKSVRFLRDNDSNNRVTVGDAIAYTITYTNNSAANTDASNFIISDLLPPQLTYNPGSATITNQTPGSTITLNPNYDGTATNSALTNSGTLLSNGTITITLSATINNANNGNDIANQASATFTTANNPNNTIITDANSNGGTANPPAVVGQFFAQVADDTVNTGNNPLNSADDDPTIIRVIGQPLLLLVKRITAIDNNPINTVIDAASDPNDTNPNWPANYLRGAVAAEAQPGAEVEYTIYFLSTGNSSALNVTLCDLITPNQTFVLAPTAFSTVPSAGGGSDNRGIVALLDNSNPSANIRAYTNGDDGDLGRFIAPGITLPPVCTINGGTNTNGAIVFDLGNIPFAINAGNPANSYGFVRFRTRIN